MYPPPSTCILFLAVSSSSHVSSSLTKTRHRVWRSQAYTLNPKPVPEFHIPNDLRWWRRIRTIPEFDVLKDKLAMRRPRFRGPLPRNHRRRLRLHRCVLYVCIYIYIKNVYMCIYNTHTHTIYIYIWCIYMRIYIYTKYKHIYTMCVCVLIYICIYDICMHIYHIYILYLCMHIYQIYILYLCR
jgi:hypothetical protein